MLGSIWHFLPDSCADLRAWDQFIEAAGHLVVILICDVVLMDVADGWIVDLEQLGAEAGEHCDRAGVEHENQEGVVPRPRHVVHLQIGLASAVKRRIVLRRDELVELHRADELILEVDEEELAVDLVDAIDGHSYQVALVVGSGNQCFGL